MVEHPFTTMASFLPPARSLKNLRPLVSWAAALAALAPLVRAAEEPATFFDREGQSLNGEWRAIVDPYDTGYYDYRSQPYDQQAHPPHDAFFMDAKPRSSSDLLEYDFDRARTLRVPGDWNTQAKELFYYEGSVWYRRTFAAPSAAPGTRVFLDFGAANARADVYLNGEKLGVHVGGFTPFAFEVSGRLRPDRNSLVVRVNNTRTADGIPALATDWWNYGGLTRDVKVVVVPATFIAAHRLSLESELTHVISGSVRLEGAHGGETVEVSIPELGIRATATAAADGMAAVRLAAPQLELWSPDHPKLYAVHVRCGADETTEPIGFRTVRTEGRRILLNGQPIFLRGICLHDEFPLEGGGRVTTPAQSAQLLGWARELGCNFVRLAHYPHNETTLRAADRLGILVWSEIPVYWAISWKNPATYAQAEQQLTEMIHRDQERAAVIIWSLANETPIIPERTDFIGRLARKARALDRTRLLAAAMERRAKPDAPNVQLVQDPLAELVDLVSFNEYLGWYEGLPDRCAQAQWEIAYNKPIFVSEFGGDAVQGRHGTRDDRWSEEYQANLYVQNLAMLDRIPGLAGMSPWILIDFRSPRRMLAGTEDGYNRKGLISSAGVKKAAFLILQQYYKSKVEGYVRRIP